MEPQPPGSELEASSSHLSMEALHSSHFSGVAEHSPPPGRKLRFFFFFFSAVELWESFLVAEIINLSQRAKCLWWEVFLTLWIKLSLGTVHLLTYFYLLDSLSPIFAQFTSSCCSGLSHFTTIHYQLSLNCPGQEGLSRKLSSDSSVMMKKN